MADQATEWNEINTVYCKGISRSLHHQFDTLLPERQLTEHQKQKRAEFAEKRKKKKEGKKITPTRGTISPTQYNSKF